MLDCFGNPNDRCIPLREPQYDRLLSPTMSLSISPAVKNYWLDHSYPRFSVKIPSVGAHLGGVRELRVHDAAEDARERLHQVGLLHGHHQPARLLHAPHAGGDQPLEQLLDLLPAKAEETFVGKIACLSIA
jgi:hypothetical protein